MLVCSRLNTKIVVTRHRNEPAEESLAAADALATPVNVEHAEKRPDILQQRAHGRGP